MNSILLTVKKMLGLLEEDTSFDTDLIVIINSVIASLTQIGLGDLKGFMITGPDEEWSDLIQNDSLRLNTVQTYVFLRTKKIFDPPTGSLMNSYDETIKELEWRIQAEVDYHSFEGT